MKINFNMLSKSYKLLFYLVVFLFAVSSVVNAQVKNDNIRDKIEKIKLEKLIKRLELDDETAEVFTVKYKNFVSVIKELNQKRVQTYKLMVSNLESGDGLDTLVDKLLDYESRIAKERDDFASDLKTILTSKQIAVMIVFERKFNAQLKKILQNYRKRNNKNN
ncbi:hypothetical protein LJE82_05945 [bacterium BMS3Abin03]|nr:hypothetical protein [bacterium BMS3Abin03]